MTWEVAVPVRGTGCILRGERWHDADELVAVPVRGAGCISKETLSDGIQAEVAVPVRGAGCIGLDKPVGHQESLLSPWGVRAASIICHDYIEYAMLLSP